LIILAALIAAFRCRRHVCERGYGGSIPVAVTVSHDDLPVREVQILHPQRQAFLQPQSTTVKDVGDQPVLPFKVGEDGPDLNLRQHHGQVTRRLGADHAVEPGQFQLQNLLIEEQQGGERLVLRCRRNVAVDGQVGKEGLDIAGAHVEGVTLAIEQDKSANPVQILLFGPVAVEQRSEPIADLIQQARFCVHAVKPPIAN